jgi:glycosyltransferase involved in cell wall biosynthesis
MTVRRFFHPFPVTGIFHKLAIVVPTIGRYAELRRMLSSLAQQTRWPEQVLIVGEGGGNAEIAEEFPQLHAEFISFPGSSICDARNRGVQAARPDNDLIAFMDDDIVLEPQAIQALLGFWDQAPEDLGGTGCNLVNYPSFDAPRLKTLRLTSRLGLYDSRRGVVLRSGIHTMMPGIQETTYVQWLPTYAVVYSRKVLGEFSFDEWFETYSYLEDLDFSYRIGKKYKLAVVADARFYHYPSRVGRTSAYLFGKKEVLNRLHFVSKHPELSRPLCCLALLIRALMSIFFGFAEFESDPFKRVAGNLTGLFLARARGPNAAASEKQTHGLA